MQDHSANFRPSRRALARHTRIRRGVAPIEFLLYLPVFSVFMLVLIWVSKVRLAEMQAGYEAADQVQGEAAQSDQRNEVPGGEAWADLRAPELRQLVDGFEPGLSLSSGGIQATGDVDSGAGVPMAISPLGSLRDFSVLMTHAWEDRVFDFPDGNGEQPQLTLPPEVSGVAVGLGDLAAFTRLRNFSGGSLASALPALGTIGQSLVEAARALQEGIRSLENSIAQIDAQLAALRSSEFPDEAQIRALEEERREQARQLSQLKKGLEHYRDAREIGNSLATPDPETDD